MAVALKATNPPVIAHALREQLDGTEHQVYLSPYNRFQSTESIYWLTRLNTGPFHYLAKGTVLPYARGSEPPRLLVGLYVEKGFQVPNPETDSHPHLLMDERWDWHAVARDPARLESAMRMMWERGGPGVVVMRTRCRTLHFDFDGQLSVALDEPLSAEGCDGDLFSYCGAARSISDLLTVLSRIPDVERHYVDLIVGHTFPLREEMGVTALQLFKRSIEPWKAWIWPPARAR